MFNSYNLLSFFLHRILFFYSFLKYKNKNKNTNRLNLQRQHNVGQKARVYDTFQMYLKSSPRELERSIKLSEREGWHWGGKLVRGAYMVLERQRAKDMEYESPIHETLEDTHDCYDQGVIKVLSRTHVQNKFSSANLLIVFVWDPLFYKQVHTQHLCLGTRHDKQSTLFLLLLSSSM